MFEWRKQQLNKKKTKTKQNVRLKEKIIIIAQYRVITRLDY